MRTPVSVAAAAGYVVTMGVKSVPDGVIHSFNAGGRAGSAVGKQFGRLITFPVRKWKSYSLKKEAGGQETLTVTKQLEFYNAKAIRPFQYLGATIGGAFSLPLSFIAAPTKGLYNILKGMIHFIRAVRELNASNSSETIKRDLSLPETVIGKLRKEAKLKPEYQEEFTHGKHQVLPYSVKIANGDNLLWFLLENTETGVEEELMLKMEQDGHYSVRHLDRAQGQFNWASKVEKEGMKPNDIVKHYIDNPDSFKPPEQVV
ncbi:hypothetical protein [Endozoicomonas numazuensis]|uniref:Uncharacterized protein n=1 Tax=Endozoicomonas numazuensis TaxID=1137799 RepID=A0A081NEG6_9GAMM|nr:hypothetical protein [Endozoicomonas numazuensis]KEQ16839.1 hypothetical protein GZ78_19435 [Endozoicomonas numazuensis]